MRRLLIRFLTFMDSNNKALFWASWFFLMSPLFSRLLRKYSVEDAAPGPSNSVQIAMIVSLVMGVWGWKIFWKILERERFLPVRDAIITLGGFVLIHFVLLVSALAVAALLSFLIPEGIGELPLYALYLVIPFVGGCWIGFKRDRFIPIWCTAGVIFFWVWLSFGVGVLETDFMITEAAILHVILAILGGYFADNMLREEASDPLSQGPYQPRD